jgi:hypothetical protein
VLITLDNVSEKSQLLNQDFSRVNWNNLLLLNSRNNEETYENMTGLEAEDYKHNSNVNRNWSVSIGAKEQFTWIISTNEDYSRDNFAKWGFK